MDEYIATIESNNIVTKTNLSGIITFASDDFCALCGFNRLELLGSNHNIIRHPDTPSEYFAQMWETILAGKVHRGVVKNKRKNGEPFWAQTTIIPVIKCGKIVEFVAFRHDLSELFLAQQKLLDQERIIAAQSRQAALGQMISNIAHQWRQPLNELALELYLLKNGSASSYLRSRKLVEQMSQMIENLNDFSRKSESAKYVQLSDIYKIALGFLRMSIKNAQMRLRFRGDFRIKVRTRKNEIAQVIVNIIKNALEATQNMSANNAVLLLCAQKHPDGALLGFYDNGAGFINEAAVFDLYYSSKHPSAGVGLGLYICRQVLEAASSEIATAPSELGGAGFRVILRDLNG